MKFFVDPYKKYYEKLNGAGSMSSDASDILSNVSTLKSNASGISGKISSSTWKEIGASEVVNTIIPGLTTLLNKLSTDVSSTLQQAVSKALGEILPKATELKTKDEEYEKLEEEIKTLKSSEPSYSDSSDGGESSAHSTWRNNVETKEKELLELEKQCKKLQEEIDAAAKAINSLEVSKAEQQTVTVGTGTQSLNQSQVIANDGTFSTINYSGSVFKVINTKNISVTDFVKFINDYHLNQTDNAAKYGNSCLGVAKAYGNRMYNNTKLYRGMDDFYSGGYTAYDNGTSSSNKQYILGLIYDELVQGKPSVLMVTTKAGHRHFATVVGMKASVTSRDTIREEDLLIIDSWDGKLEAMDNSATADRHMHTQNGKYRVDRLKA